VPYDVQKDLAPVVITSSQPNVLAVNAALPIKSVADLVAYAKANPGKLNYASVGNGSSSHLNAELLKSMTGIDAVHVPFNGSPPAVLATVQGETQMMFAVMQPLQAQVQAGKLRAESGYPGFEALAWNGLVAPAGTPRPVIDKINAEVNAILKQPDVVQKMNAAGFDLIGGTPEDFAKLIAAETARWTPVVKRLGIVAN
jgi:tripartite-type tricarboxylate transporter receptor subunit TctC